jgi:formylglycine-generating enzyme required for sulfatase activity
VSVDGDETVRLPLAVPPPREPLPARLRRLLRDKPWRLGRQLRDWAATAPAETLLADRIFLHTVVRPRVLDLLLPRALRNLLSRRLARPLPPPAEGKARPLAAAAGLVLLILTGHWAWQGSGWLAAAGLDMGLSGQAAALWTRGNAGLRGWAHDRLLARQLAPNQGYRIEIRYRPAGPDPLAPDPQATRDLGLALTAALGQADFTDITRTPLETADAAQDTPAPDTASQDTPTQRSAGAQAAAATPQAALNSIQIGADAALPAAEQVQAQLRHLAWGARPQLTNILETDAEAPAALEPPPANTIRVWLRNPGHRGVFTDPIRRGLTDAERAAFRAEGGLDLPAPSAEAGLQSFAPFRDRLADGSDGPTLVPLPGGWLMMGSPEDEPERSDDEGPRHAVRIEPFAIGRTEVTVADFRTFVDATDHVTDAERGAGCFVWSEEKTEWAQRRYADWRAPGFAQDDNSPVVCVSWNDAVAYADWLSVQTGEDYRLPTEAEWEYATRAGTETPFWTGDCIHTDQANYDGNSDYNDCGADTGVYRQQTVAAGSLPANPFGLHEVAGNAWEWVADCWHDSYDGAPIDGSAWLGEDGGDCARRVVRGGGWGDFPRGLRSAFRYWCYPFVATFNVCFRLASTL